MEVEKPSYLKAMLTSPGNQYAALGSLATAVLLSIPFGFGVGAVPLIAFAAGEIIAAMYIPSSPRFREKVDQEARTANRIATRNRLLGEIERRTQRSGSFQRHINTYLRMAERVDVLYRQSAVQASKLSRRDVEKLDDATIEYLCMWLAILVMDDRAASINLREINNRITAITNDLASPQPGADVRQLQKARADYIATTERHHRMISRKRALEAAMVSMPDQLEEIYQTLMTTPTTAEASTQLDDAIAKLRLEEDIEAELAGDIEEAVPGIAPPTRRSAGVASAMAKQMAASANGRN